MRKGELRRQNILNAAEKLLYTRGYESTSVQDIIDALGFSKGGFYHHFESKLALLEAICEDRAQRAFALAERAVSECDGDAVEKLDALFQSATMLQSDSVDFISLLLRVAYREDGALMREKMKQQQLLLYLPLMQQIIDEGVAQGDFFTPFPVEIGEMIMRLSMQLTDEIAFLLAKAKRNPEVLMTIFDKLKLYRHAIEHLLNAPFGRINILQLHELEKICRWMLLQQ